MQYRLFTELGGFEEVGVFGNDGQKQKASGNAAPEQIAKDGFARIGGLCLVLIRCVISRHQHLLVAFHHAEC